MHAHTADSMLDEKSETLENALEESAAMAERLATRSRGLEQGHAAGRFEERARDAREQATVIRRVLIEGGAADAITEPA